MYSVKQQTEKVLNLYCVDMADCQVPKYINNNVVRALFALQSTGYRDFIQRDVIAAQVKSQIRSNRPEEQIENFITKSLNKLTMYGVLAQSGGSEYGMRCLLRYDEGKAKPEVLNTPEKTRLGPRNLATNIISKESMSSSSLTRARRSNSKHLSKNKKPCKLKRPSQSIGVKSKVSTNIRKAKSYVCFECQDVMEGITKAFKILKKRDQEARQTASPVPVIKDNPSDLSSKKVGQEQLCGQQPIETNDGVFIAPSQNQDVCKVLKETLLCRQSSRPLQDIGPLPQLPAVDYAGKEPVIKSYDNVSIPWVQNQEVFPGSLKEISLSPQSSRPLQEIVPLSQTSAVDYAGPEPLTNLSTCLSTDKILEQLPNTDNASILGLCGSSIRLTDQSQRRWAPFWERKLGVSMSVPEVESQPTWLPMPLPKDPGRRPFN